MAVTFCMLSSDSGLQMLHMTRYVTRMCHMSDIILGRTQWWYLMAMRAVIRRKPPNNRDEHQTMYPEICYLMTQASFLANATNKSRLIAMIITKFQHHGISIRQADADADSLIASTGLTLAMSEKANFVIIGTDSDLLIILVPQATSKINVHFCT